MVTPSNLPESPPNLFEVHPAPKTTTTSDRKLEFKMVLGWGDSHDAHKQVYGKEDNPKFSQELLAGAASFEGFRLFENHQRKEGKPVSHAFAKELLVGFVGGEVDKMAQKRHMSAEQKDEAKQYAQGNAESLYDEHYVQEQGAQQYDPNQYRAPSHF
ncbi:Glutathione synthetase [Ophidiomyces ophidiicola]|nr:Glutathione synthetase [Ophidiomyces ophidiicola]KAI1966087.1 Glutathione synthetase [Ophidiomyces ophidiicola]